LAFEGANGKRSGRQDLLSPEGPLRRVFYMAQRPARAGFRGFDAGRNWRANFRNSTTEDNFSTDMGAASTQNGPTRILSESPEVKQSNCEPCNGMRSKGGCAHSLPASFGPDSPSRVQRRKFTCCGRLRRLAAVGGRSRHGSTKLVSCAEKPVGIAVTKAWGLRELIHSDAGVTAFGWF